MMKIAGVREVSVRAPGKVNLQLTVGEPDERGMHPLATVFQAVSVYEEVTAHLTTSGSGITISVSGRDADRVPTDATNIAHQAALQIARATGVVNRDGEPDIHLHIEKEVPVGGGMAGGSADAAATLVACNELWRTHLSQTKLDEIGAELGADVTFCMHGGMAVGTGYGERLAPVLSAGEYFWLFVLDSEPISTGAAYRELDERERQIPDPLVVRSELMAALRSGDPAAVGAELRNDFQELALEARPELRKIFEFAEENLAAGAVVSGSGPTVAILAPSLWYQRELKAAFSDAGVGGELVTAHGPVHGARVVC